MDILCDVVTILPGKYCVKTFYWNDDKNPVPYINHARGSSAVYILIYKLRVDWAYNQKVKDEK